jgi:MFS family permease
MSTSLMSLTFKEPVFQVRLNKENLSLVMIGVLFSLDTITYTLTSIALNFLPEKSKDFGKLVAVGMVVFTAAMLLTGPAHYILPDRLWVICVGILLQGVGGALVNNNCVPALS